MCSEAQRRGGLLCEDTTTLVVRSTRATPTAWVAIFALDAAAPATTTLSEPATAGVRATPATTSSTTPTGSRRGAGAWNTLTGTRTAPPRCANPGPVGLLGFGLSTILLNLHNTGSFPLSTVIVAMGICLGGGAQFIAGLLEWVRGNTFAYVAFTSYGAFWLSLVCVWMLPNTAAGTSKLVDPASEYFVGVYLFLWGIFSFVMLLCTIRMNLAIFLVFLTVTLLFLMLGCSSMASSAVGLRAAGYEGIICGSLALYLAFAEILNEMWDRTILPVIPMTQVLGWLGASPEKASDSAELENHEQPPKGN